MKDKKSSGYPGVCLITSTGQWEAKLTFKGVTYKERFNTIEGAIRYRKLLEEKYFTPFLEELKLEN